MKFTVAFIVLLSVATTWAEKIQKAEDVKDKREAPVGYPSAGHSSHSYQAPSLGHEGASAISIGAGYSVGGAKSGYSYEAPEISAGHSLSSDGLPSSGHATIQLAPITLQPNHGGLVGTDLNQLMSQLQQSLNSGALTLQAPEGYGGSYQAEGQSSYGGQEQDVPQYSYGVPKQQYSIAEQPQPSVPSYAAGTKGLGSYSSTGPVLFNPSDAHSNAPTLNYGAPSAGHSFGSSGAISLGSGGHSFAGFPQGGSGQSFSGPYKSFGSYAGPSKNAFKPSAYIGSTVQGDSHGLSSISGSYAAPSFGAHSLSGGHGGLSLGSGSHGGFAVSSGGHGGHAPSSGGHGYSLSSSALTGHSLGSGSPGGHSLGSAGYGSQSLSSGGHSGLSFGSAGHGASFGGSAGHGASFGGSHGFGGGSSKYISQAYLPAKSEGFGSLESVAAFSSSGHLASPPSTTYGVPSGSYGLPGSASHAASSHSPQYYVGKSHASHGSFGEGSSSYRAPSSSLSSLKSYPKYSSGYSSPTRYMSPKDPLQGAYSENSYNTIKYSQELKAVPQ